MKTSLKPKLTVLVRSCELKSGSYVSKDTGKTENYTALNLGTEVVDGNDCQQVRVGVSLRDVPVPPSYNRGDVLELSLDGYIVEKGNVTARVSPDGIKVIKSSTPAK